MIVTMTVMVIIVILYSAQRLKKITAATIAIRIVTSATPATIIIVTQSQPQFKTLVKPLFRKWTSQEKYKKPTGTFVNKLKAVF